MAADAPVMRFTETAESARVPRRTSRTIVVVGAIALTTFFALLYALRAGIASQDRGEAVAWGEQIWTSVVIWWSCLPLVPAMAWLVRTVPVVGQRWLRHAVILLAGTLLLAATRQLAMAPVVALLLPRPEVPGSDLARTLSYCATFLVVVGFLHAGYFYEGLRAREVEAARLAQSLAEARLATLRTQLQPHFLFNTLNAITALVHQDPYVADRMLTRLAALLRTALHAPPGEEHALREELAILDQYLDVMTVRFGDRLTVERDIDPTLLEVPVPWMVLQPLVENALEHGLGGRAGPGTVRIAATRAGDALQLTIEDDGTGVSDVPHEATDVAGEEGDRGSGGIGLDNTRRRLQQLYGNAGSLTLEAGAHGGARARVRLPLPTTRSEAGHHA